MINYNSNYKRLDGESDQEFENRCYKQKLLNNDVTWFELSKILNHELNLNYSESRYRKRCNSIFVENAFQKNDTEIAVEQLQDLLLDIRKEKVKLSDERAQNNAFIRKMAREDTIREIAKEYAAAMSNKKILNPINLSFKKEEDKAGILMLSDWHYGLEVNNVFNTYNEDIFLQRINQLRDEADIIIKENKISYLHIVNLSDLIAGRIHASIRMQSRCDVISQTMFVSEVLAELLTHFSSYCKVYYHDVLDNHSRLEPNKNDSLDLESLVRIIPWYLRERLSDNADIIFDEEQQGVDIAHFKVFNFKVAATHGHKDRPSKVIDNMTNMLGTKNDLVLTAHRHHFSAEEESNCIRVSNGCLIGVDDYSQSLRLLSRPSQTFIIATPKLVCKEIHRIELT